MTDASLWQSFSIAFILAGALCAYWALKTFRARLLQYLSALPTKRIKDDQRVRTLSTVVLNAGYFFIFLISGMMILRELHFDPTPVLASAGIVGVAASFGAQSLIKDVSAGLFILLEDQYREGDNVQLDEVSGIVERVTLRKTVLIDAKKTRHHIPNGAIKIASVFDR